MTLFCSEFEKGKIITLLESGMTIAQVAAETGRHRNTIRRWSHRYADEGEAGMAKRPKSGRPSSTTAEQDAAMVQVRRELRLPF